MQILSCDAAPWTFCTLDSFTSGCSLASATYILTIHKAMTRTSSRTMLFRQNLLPATIFAGSCRGEENTQYDAVYSVKYFVTTFIRYALLIPRSGFYAYLTPTRYVVAMGVGL